jgi:hypothetical protein
MTPTLNDASACKCPRAWVEAYVWWNSCIVERINIASYTSQPVGRIASWLPTAALPLPCATTLASAVINWKVRQLKLHFTSEIDFPMRSTS